MPPPVIAPDYLLPSWLKSQTTVGHAAKRDPKHDAAAKNTVQEALKRAPKGDPKAFGTGWKLGKSHASAATVELAAKATGNKDNARALRHAWKVASGQKKKKGVKITHDEHGNKLSKAVKTHVPRHHAAGSWAGLTAADWGSIGLAIADVFSLGLLTPIITPFIIGLTISDAVQPYTGYAQNNNPNVPSVDDSTQDPAVPSTTVDVSVTIPPEPALAPVGTYDSNDDDFDDGDDDGDGNYSSGLSIAGASVRANDGGALMGPNGDYPAYSATQMYTPGDLVRVPGPPGSQSQVQKWTGASWTSDISKTDIANFIGKPKTISLAGAGAGADFDWTQLIGPVVGIATSFIPHQAAPTPPTASAGNSVGVGWYSPYGYGGKDL